MSNNKGSSKRATMPYPKGVWQPSGEGLNVTFLLEAKKVVKRLAILSLHLLKSHIIVWVVIIQLDGSKSKG